MADDLRDEMDRLAMQIAEQLTGDAALHDKIDGLKTLTTYYVAMNGKLKPSPDQGKWGDLQRRVTGANDGEAA